MQFTSDISKAVIYSVLGSLSFAGMTALIKATQGYSLVQVIFFRSFVSVLLIWLVGRMGNKSVKFTSSVPKLHLFRVLFGVFSMVCFFAAYRTLEIATVSALTFSKPLFVFLLAKFYLGEAFRLNRAVSVIIGFLGVLVVLNPGSQSFDPMSLVVVLGALSAAFAMLFVKRLTKTESVLTVAFIFMLAVSLFSLVLLPWHWKTPNLTDLTILSGVGFLGGFGQIFLVLSYKYADASFVAPLAYLHLVWTSILGFMFWYEVPSVGLIIGSGIIFLSQIYLVKRERLDISNRV